LYAERRDGISPTTGRSPHCIIVVRESCEVDGG
jgi:hypothetical protein